MAKVLSAIYIFVGTKLEERDLVTHIGPQYEKYQRTAPKFFPLPRGKG